MYQQFYNFSAEPFRLSPDHGFAYAHKGYTKARAYMDYAFLRAEGFVMITGRPGTGKTTLIGALLDELANTSVRVANLVCTQLQADDLLKLVAYEFGIPVSVVEKGELLQRLTQQLKSWHRDGRRALLIVDEAQDLSISAMEELRLLTNIQVDSRPLLQIFLLGQPELRELILSPRLEQVHQRIIAASHLGPLESDETEAYIRHRLNAVHWRGNPAISKTVYPLVYKFSEGVPRRINLICSRLLLHCAVEQRNQVAVADVRVVVQELQDENLASGNGFSQSDFQLEDVFDEDRPTGDDPGGTTMSASRMNTAASPETRPADGDAVSATRHAREVVGADPAERGNHHADNAAPQVLQQSPRLRLVAASGSEGSMRPEVESENEAVFARGVTAEETSVGYERQVMHSAPETPRFHMKNQALNDAGEPTQYADSRPGRSRQAGTRRRGGSGKKAVGRRVAKSELPRSRSEAGAVAADSLYSSATGPLLVILLLTLSSAAWLVLDLEVDMFDHLIPPALTAVFR